MGVRDSTERPKIRCLRRKGYRKNEQRFRHVMLHTGRINFIFCFFKCVYAETIIRFKTPTLFH